MELSSNARLQEPAQSLWQATEEKPLDIHLETAGETILHQQLLFSSERDNDVLAVPALPLDDAHILIPMTDIFFVPQVTDQSTLDVDACCSATHVVELDNCTHFVTPPIGITDIAKVGEMVAIQIAPAIKKYLCIFKLLFFLG